jgi:hypothetical protein
LVDLVFFFSLRKFGGSLQEFEDAEIETEAGTVSHQDATVATRETEQTLLLIDV